ncbi:MAG: sulfite exporter TauE/SafE family protein [Candidatus Micrarchaeota archaeon]
MKKTFAVTGMHCHSCEKRIEDALVGAGATHAKVDFAGNSAEVEWEEGKATEEALVAAIRKEGYGASASPPPAEETEAVVQLLAAESDAAEEPEGGAKKNDKTRLYLAYALIGVLSLVFIWMVASTPGFSIPEVSLPSPGSPVALAAIFGVGLLTGLHCVGMCGAFCAASANTKKGLATYLGAKTVSYTATGVALGAVGGFFILGSDVRSGLAILAGVFMMLYALSVFGVGIARKFFAMLPRASVGGSKGPLAAGLLNGLMPCGPLMAMQAYALSTGSALEGGLVMLVFGLGTIPFMAGFGLVVQKMGAVLRDKVFKAGALLVLLLGLLMLGNGLSAFLPSTAATPFAVPSNATVSTVPLPSVAAATIRVSVYGYGYDPSVVEVPVGAPVRLVFDVKELTGCNSAIRIPSLGINVQLHKGENTIDLPALEAGTYDFSCGMGMLRGKIVAGGAGVVEAKAALAAAPQGGCGGSGGRCGCGGGSGSCGG